MVSEYMPIAVMHRYGIRGLFEYCRVDSALSEPLRYLVIRRRWFRL